MSGTYYPHILCVQTFCKASKICIDCRKRCLYKI